MVTFENLPFDEEGYLSDPAAWSEALAEALAEREGIVLTEKHWDVIRFCRAKGLETGKAPTLRQISQGTGVSTKELFQLFPKGPAKRIAKIAGLGKPAGCV